MNSQKRLLLALMAIHENKKYTLTVYNIVTHRNEEIEVTREVYHAYRRTGWGIENNDASFFAHEIQMSGLIGGEEGAYENFKEFIDTENIPDNTVLKIVEIEALRKAIPHVLQTLKMHIQMGLGGKAGEDESMDIQIRIAQIDKEFKDILNSVTAENQQSLLTDPRIGELMSEKRILENRLAECAAAEQKRADTESRLTNLYTILEGMKNHPMEYDDRLIRKILRCVVVQTKQRIKVVFIDGLEMEVEVEQ